MQKEKKENMKIKPRLYDQHLVSLPSTALPKVA